VLLFLLLMDVCVVVDVAVVVAVAVAVVVVLCCIVVFGLLAKNITCGVTLLLCCC